MNLILSLFTLSSIIFVHGQQNDKGATLIPFPRIGRSDPRFFMEGKRSGNSLTPGLIPFPRIGRSGSLDAFHEMKRQLIPFPRVGKRPYWRVPGESYTTESEDYSFPLVDPLTYNPSTTYNALYDFGAEENDAEKRNAASNSNNNSNNGGMWFGPRLGRRKKRAVEAETLPTSHDSMDTRTLIKILHNFNWAIVPIKEKKPFTPRLGRSSEEVGIHRRAEHYTPRLGRSQEVTSGDFDGEDEQEHFQGSRFSRGEVKSKSKGQSDDTSVGRIPFSPRLGRDHINPRLGRSGEDHE